MKVIIFGKESFLSKNLFKSIKKSSLYSLSDNGLEHLDYKNSSIIINSFYSSLKLDKINNYENFIKKSIYELSKFLDILKNKKVKNIIYSSSSSIYNSASEYEFSDERNRKIYAATKYAAESLLKNFCSKNNINLCITRIFNIFGEKEKFSIISKIINNYKNKKEKLNLINNGVSVRDFIHINDVINIYKIIIKNNYNNIIDVGSGYGIKIKDIIDSLNVKNFNLKNVKKKEDNFSIAQNLKFKLNKKNSLENFIEKKLKLKFKIKLKKIFSSKKNYLQDYLQGSIIYGAGETGQKLLKNYEKNQYSSISYFVDDDEKIIAKKKINGVKIISYRDLLEISKHKIINNIIIAIPSLSSKELKEMINRLSLITLNVSFIDLNYIGEKNYLRLSDFSETIMSEIFERKLKKKYNLIKNLNKKKVLVTGAGGSIGSELVKQLLLSGANVVALDHSEFALYNLEKDLSQNFFKFKIKTILGSINDTRILKKINKEEKIQIIFHAAAYKHVNLLENNISLAVENNIFGTKNLLDVFNYKNCEIVIISTDKAAKPKSVLGATKRISEIICQNYRRYQRINSKIKIVRFGNVFGSKGSAVELFIDQINKGNPITLTDFRAKRYFMSIQEACNLVINVTNLKENRKIYILDMGEQILLKDIIYKLANLKKIKKSQIKIKKIGLKKGEKLFEELSISKNIQKTKNKEIFLVKEPEYTQQKVDTFLEKLRNHHFNMNDKILRSLIFSFLSNEK